MIPKTLVLLDLVLFSVLPQVQNILNDIKSSLHWPYIGKSCNKMKVSIEDTSKKSPNSFLTIILQMWDYQCLTILRHIFTDLILGRGANNQNGNLRWFLPLGVAPPSPPPPNGHNFQAFFTPFLSFAIESYIYEIDSTLGLSQKYHF